MPRPAIFRDLALPAALAASKAQAKLLLVDATASWCGPCKQMDATTWIDPAVVETLGKHAIAIQFDVDAEKDTATSLAITAMPTIVAFRDGAEIDRAVGAQKSADLVAWVEGLSRGETMLQRSRAEAKAKPDDVRARMSLAQKLLEAGALEEATNEYVWLWNNMAKDNPALGGVRQSFFLTHLQKLTARHPPARDAIDQLRSAVAPKVDAQPELESLSEWFSLNHALQEDDKSLEWFLAARPHLTFEPRFESLLEQRVVPLLVAKERWAEVGSLYQNPMEAIARAKSFCDHVAANLPKDAPAELAESLKGFALQQLRETAERLARALTAANRTDDAARVIAESTRLDPSPEMQAAIARALEPKPPAAS